MISKKISNPNKQSSKAVRICKLFFYVTKPEAEDSTEKCLYWEGRNFIFPDDSAMVKEMIALASETVHSKDPIDHWMISWREDEKPDLDQVKEAMEIFLTHLGVADLQVIWALHDDTTHRHVHIEINKVNPITHRVRKINKGFDKEAGQQAIALIEEKQGWKPAENARYTVIDGKPVLQGEKLTPVKPSATTRAIEVLAGEKQPETIVQEVAGPIIRGTKSWNELHQALAKENMRYERFGSGAMVYVGEVGIKASRVDRNGSIAKLAQRFGPYEPAQEVSRSDCFDTNARGKVGSKNGQRIRRFTGRTPEPAQSAGLTWKQYSAALDEHRKCKAAAREALDTQHRSEWAKLRDKQKRQRDAAYDLPRNGSRHLYNLLVAQLAREQAPLRAALAEQHRSDLRNLRQLYPAMPVFKIWLSQPRITAEVLLPKEQQKVVSRSILNVGDKRLSEDLRALKVSEDERCHIIYTNLNMVFFKDEGWTVTVVEPDSLEVCAMALALALALEKFGPELSMNGSDEFKRRVACASVEYCIVTHFRDRSLEAIRVAMQQSNEEIYKLRTDEAVPLPSPTPAAALLSTAVKLMPAPSVSLVATVTPKAAVSVALAASLGVSEHIKENYYPIYQMDADEAECSESESDEIPR